MRSDSGYDPTDDRHRLTAQARAVAAGEHELLTELVTRLELADGFPMVDVGCADGALSVLRLGQMRAKLCGIDRHPEMLAAAQAAHVDGRWLCGDVGALRDPIEPVPVVWSSRVVHHVADVDGFVAACWELVAPGGVMVLGFPDDRHVVAHPGDVDLRWLLSGMAGIPGVSRRHGTEELLAAVAVRTSCWELRIVGAPAAPTGDVLAALLDWRLQRIAEHAPGKLGAMKAAAARFRAAVERGEALLYKPDTFVLAWRSWSLINLMPCVPLEKRVTA